MEVEMGWAHIDDCPKCHQKIEPGSKFRWTRRVTQRFADGKKMVKFEAEHVKCPFPEASEVEEGLKQIRLAMQ